MFAWRTQTPSTSMNDFNFSRLLSMGKLGLALTIKVAYFHLGLLALFSATLVAWLCLENGCGTGGAVVITSAPL